MSGAQVILYLGLAVCGTVCFLALLWFVKNTDAPSSSISRMEPFRWESTTTTWEKIPIEEGDDESPSVPPKVE